MQRTWGGGTRSITSSTVVSLAFCRSGSRVSAAAPPSAAASHHRCFLRLLRDERARSQGKPRLGPHSVCCRGCEGCYFLSVEWLSASHGWLSSLISLGLPCHGGKSNSARRFPPLATLTEPHLTLLLPRSLHLFCTFYIPLCFLLPWPLSNLPTGKSTLSFFWLQYCN